MNHGDLAHHDAIHAISDLHMGGLQGFQILRDRTTGELRAGLRGSERWAPGEHRRRHLRRAAAAARPHQRGRGDKGQSRQIARWQLRGSTGLARAWALGTLAELELLGSVYDATHDIGQASQAIAQACREIVEAVGPESFAVASTRRQFEPYLNDWKHERWRRQAQAAFDALTDAQ